MLPAGMLGSQQGSDFSQPQSTSWKGSGWGRCERPLNLEETLRRRPWLAGSAFLWLWKVAPSGTALRNFGSSSWSHTFWGHLGPPVEEVVVVGPTDPGSAWDSSPQSLRTHDLPKPGRA